MWMVILDLPKWKCDKMGIEGKIRELLSYFQTGSQDRPVEDYFILPEQLEALCCSLPFGQYRGPPRRNVEDAKWKCIREQFFSVYNIKWPPCIAHLSHMFRTREAEVVVAADACFPDQPVGSWMRFDSNHMLERSLNHPVPDGGTLRCPWQFQVPTNTSLSAICGRHIDSSGAKSFKLLNALEAIRMSGWDLAHWFTGPFSTAHPKQDRENLIPYQINLPF